MKPEWAKDSPPPAHSTHAMHPSLPPDPHPDPHSDPHAQDRRVRDQILAGDREAAEELFQRHLDSLYEFVYYRVGRDSAAAEDVVQETLLVGFDKLVDFDGRSSLHSWLCGIAKNKIRSSRRKRRPLRMDEILDQADPAIDELLANIEREPLPEDVVMARETAELVGATLSSLPPDYRADLVDKYTLGKTVREMAQASGLHPKAAESRLHRARLAFTRVFTLLAGSRGGLE